MLPCCITIPTLGAVSATNDLLTDLGMVSRAVLDALTRPSLPLCAGSRTAAGLPHFFRVAGID